MVLDQFVVFWGGVPPGLPLASASQSPLGFSPVVPGLPLASASHFPLGFNPVASSSQSPLGFSLPVSPWLQAPRLRGGWSHGAEAKGRLGG